MDSSQKEKKKHVSPAKKIVIFLTEWAEIHFFDINTETNIDVSTSAGSIFTDKLVQTVTLQEEGCSVLDENMESEKINAVYTSDEQSESEQGEKICDATKPQESV